MNKLGVSPWFVKVYGFIWNYSIADSSYITIKNLLCTKSGHSQIFILKIFFAKIGERKAEGGIILMEE